MRKQLNEKKVLKFILVAAAVVSLAGLAVMSLWNVVLAQVVAVKTISFVQALGLFALSKILFGGFRGGGFGGRRGGLWARDMKEKWQQMSPEERLQFKEQWKNKCRPGSKEQSANS